MKKTFYNLILTWIVLFLSNTTPAIAQTDDIPLVDGKVVFSKYIKAPVDKDSLHIRAIDFLKNDLKPFSGDILLDNESKTICNVIDYLVISQNFINVFAVYMSYALTFQYDDNLLLVRISNITFMEKGDYENKVVWESGQSPYRNQRTDTFPAKQYTAKEVFIDHAYQETLFKQASQRVTNAALDRFDTVFEETEKGINNAKKKVERQKGRWKKEKHHNY